MRRESQVNGATHENGQALYNTEIRHGFGVISPEWMQYLAQRFQNYYDDKRHETNGNLSTKKVVAKDWRITERHRTVNAALVLCLNLGVDPPDVIKPQSCAKLEAWVNPKLINDSKRAIEQIGKNLQGQYEALSTKTRYKQCLDPNVADAKRFFMGLRRSAREERILFHYNGHGVPKPTASGELWVFNRGFTQYIPVSIYELQSWLGSPVIYCYDCSAAGNIIRNFNDFVEKRKREEVQQQQQRQNQSQQQHEQQQELDRQSQNYGEQQHRSHRYKDSRRSAQVNSEQPELERPNPPSTQQNEQENPEPNGVQEPEALRKESEQPRQRHHRRQDHREEQQNPHEVDQQYLSESKHQNQQQQKKDENNLVHLQQMQRQQQRQTHSQQQEQQQHSDIQHRNRNTADQPVEQASFSAASFDNCIQMGACRADEVLPMHPSLPADVFTCCITTPVEIAIKSYVLQNPWLGIDPVKTVIPGKIADRRTPLGELNWIFTAITDTIAWSALDTALFKRLFRQDLVVAAMFRNFLLACRIMRLHNCHPVSSPELPPTHNHPMWDSWDLAIGSCIIQLPALQEADREGRPYDFQHTNFFEQQLSAFEVWLKYNSSDLNNPPEQLPVLLQVLLSQIHRLRALLLLGGYLDLGHRAVQIALSIGFFIYVLKLLQSPAPELRPVLVFIWTKIMAFDYADIQHELVKENGFTYFVNILTSDHVTSRDANAQQNGSKTSHSTTSSSNAPTSAESYQFKPNDASRSSPYLLQENYDTLAMSAFVVSQFVRDSRQGQRLCVSPELFTAFLHHLGEDDYPLLRQWSLLCLSKLWENYNSAKEMVAGLEDKGVYLLDAVIDRFNDPIPEVRAAALVALTTFLPFEKDKIAKEVLSVALDASPLVRKEALVLISKIVHLSLPQFVVCAFTTVEEEYNDLRIGDPRSESPAHNSTTLACWRLLLVLSVDSWTQVSLMTQKVVDFVFAKLYESPLGHETFQMLKGMKSAKDNGHMHVSHATHSSFDASNQSQKGFLSQVPSSPSSLDFHASFTDHTQSSTRPTISRSVSVPMQSAISRPLRQDRRIVSTALHLARSWWSGKEEVGTTDSSAIPQRHLPTPTSPGFSKQHMQGGLVSCLPLESSFYDWSVEYFSEPQLNRDDQEQPGSQRFLQRLWRKARNERVLSETQPQKDLAVYGTWNNLRSLLPANRVCQKITFAQYEPHILGMDNADTVTVWDWKTSERICQFSNNNATGTNLIDAKFINEDDQPMVLTTSSDGVARVIRNYADSDKLELATSWWLLADLLPQRRNSAICTEWHQSRGSLLVAGDVRVIRVWDAGCEQIAEDIPVRTSSKLTSLTMDQVAGNIVVAGFNDGTIQAYDRRLGRNSALIRRWNPGTSCIINVKIQRGGARELVSGSVDGKVNLWDVRMTETVLGFMAHTREMHSLEVHEHAPIIATGSRLTGIWTTNGRRVSTMKWKGISESQKLTDVSSLAFHPHHMMIAMSGVSCPYVDIFECAPT